MSTSTPGAPGPLNPTANTPGLSYSNFAQYVAQTLLADQLGTVPGIPNALATASLDSAVLVDSAKIDAFRSTIADQLNASSAKHGGPTFDDLAERIADVVVTTSAQGAGTLEVHVIDPYWVLGRAGFIQADEDGFLLPLDVQFPTGTECVWRLAQYRPSFASGANLVLTFEDRIVSYLREMSAGNGGIRQGQPNQTLKDFFGMLIDAANNQLRLRPPIRFVHLIAGADPNATAQLTQVPAGAQKKIQPRGLDAQMQAILREWSPKQGSLLGGFPSGGTTPASIKAVEQLTAGKVAQLNARNPPEQGISSPPGGGYVSSTQNAAGYPIFTPSP